MAATIFTAGYTGSTPDDLAAYVEATGAVLVDVRYSARSRVRRWDGWALADRFHGRYLGLPAFGNRNYKSGPIELAAPDVGVRRLQPILQAGQSVILLCACKDWRTCHRTEVARYLTEHLPPSLVGRVEHLPTKLADWKGVA